MRFLCQFSDGQAYDFDEIDVEVLQHFLSGLNSGERNLAVWLRKRLRDVVIAGSAVLRGGSRARASEFCGVSGFGCLGPKRVASCRLVGRRRECNGC
jgi:hypothetical protein